MQNIRKQKGMSFFGWLAILVLVAFFASAAFKLIPHYMDNSALEKAIMAVEEDKTVGDKIITIAGIHGKVSEIAETTIVMETMSGKLKIEKSSISAEMSLKLNEKK